MTVGAAIGQAGGVSASLAPVGDSPPRTSNGRHRIKQCIVPAQVFSMGDAHEDGDSGDGEGPVHDVTVSGFAIDAVTVTNADFANFVEATGYITASERFGYSAVFHRLLQADPEDVVGRPPATPWWLGVRGADWRHPRGRSSTIDGLDDHPVVQVSWHDAVAYCEWAGRALPTEAQWECASRGGRARLRYPWGDEVSHADVHGGPDVGTDGRNCNIWRGNFPSGHDDEATWTGTVQVWSYVANGYGLHQTVGNVWEWCADWFSPVTYAEQDVTDPTGPTAGRTRVMRGGSYLCHDSYCNRYRNAARTSNTPDSATGNLGFRTIRAFA